MNNEGTSDMSMHRMIAMILMFVGLQAFVPGCGESDGPARKSNDEANSSTSPEWYLMLGDVRAGPFSSDFIIEQAGIGRFGKDAQVWTSGQGDWEDLSSAMPGITFGGSESAGSSWSRLFREAAKLKEPKPSNRLELSASEKNNWIKRNESLIQSVWSMSGRFGPDPEVTEPVSLIGSRAILRLLRMDAEQCVARGDVQRAGDSMDAIGSLAHQQWLITASPDPGYPDSEEVFEIGPLVSLGSLSSMMQFLQKDTTASTTPALQDRARASVQWVDDSMLAFIRRQCAEPTSQNGLCEALLKWIESSRSR